MVKKKIKQKYLTKKAFVEMLSGKKSNVQSFVLLKLIPIKRKPQN
jgi:hypothetical protein